MKFRFKLSPFMAAVLTVCLILVTFSTIFFVQVLNVPSEIYLLCENEKAAELKLPIFTDISFEDKNAIEANTVLNNNQTDIITNRTAKILPGKSKGSIDANIRLFGIITVKNSTIHFIEEKELAACGATIGVKIKTEGIIVLAISDIENREGKVTSSPCRNSGIQPGDIIMSVNGKKTDTVESLIKEVNNSKGSEISLNYLHGEKNTECSIKPVFSGENEGLKIGLWVRDNTAGIGTLTFIDINNNIFAALGHGVTDADTGILLPIKHGEILKTRIIGIKKGSEGEPGEIKGVFESGNNNIGIVEINNQYGIYGTIGQNYTNQFANYIYPTGCSSYVTQGNASILADVDGKGTKEYEIEILKVSLQKINSSKGMVIRITDKELLDKTGGIIQGMSGSPIIQNGRIIGAVTHVLINDPTKGYGIFIEKMLSEAEMLKK